MKRKNHPIKTILGIDIGGTKIACGLVSNKRLIDFGADLSVSFLEILFKEYRLIYAFQVTYSFTASLNNFNKTL